MLRPCFVVLSKTAQKIQKNTSISVINANIIVKFYTMVAHEKPVPHAKQNSEICTDVIDNDIIMLEFESFRRKAFIFTRL